MNFHRISELMLATLVQRYDKYHLNVDPIQERETEILLQAVRCYIL